MPASKAKTKKLNIDRDVLGECLHTALRKLCDSPATSAAWNLIYLADDAWKHYLDLAAKNLKGMTADDAWHGLRKAAEEMEYHGKHGYAALYCIFKCFDENDWEGFSGYLSDC